MKIKDLKKNAKKELNNIEISEMDSSVKAKANEVASDVTPTPKLGFGRKQALVLSFSSLAIVLIVVIAMFTVNAVNKKTLLTNSIARPVASKENLEKLMNKSQDYRYLGSISIDGLLYKNAAKGEMMYDEAAAAPAATNDNGGTSQTVSQVEGIQESEIVKCDANYIYYSYRDKIQIFAANNGKAELVKTINLDNCLYDSSDLFIKSAYYTPAQMYLTDDKLVLMYEKVLTNGLYYDYWHGHAWRNIKTVVQIYDKENFDLLKETIVPGGLIDGREYNNHLYFVTSDSIADYKFDSVAETTNNNTSKIEFDYNDVIYVPTLLEDYPYENYICSINLETLDTNYECQLGSDSYSTIYMSENALYLCNDCSVSERNSYTPEEIIYKYGLDANGNLKYTSSGKVEGHTLNQYSLDEYNGYLRVVTSGSFTRPITIAYETFISAVNSSFSIVINAVYVLEEKEVEGGKVLQVVGKLDEGIGYPGEQVKSVKFNGEYVSIVTYRQTDPLYLIKFTDNTKIEIVDYLKVPGYSAFLLDVSINGVNYKIGVGYTDNRNYKISLYKEENETTTQVGEDYVIEVSTYNNYDNNIWIYNYCETSIVNNIRTMFLYQDSNENTLIGFNLDKYGYENNYETEEYHHYENHYYDVLRIDVESENPGLAKVNEFETTSFDSRMVAINGYYYVVSLDQVVGYTYDSVNHILVAVE